MKTQQGTNSGTRQRRTNFRWQQNFYSLNVELLALLKQILQCLHVL